MIKKEISFIIPTLNEETHIGGVLDSIRENLEGKFSYEVLVVDNGSIDQTVEIANKKKAICLHAPGCSIASMRNRGALEATADIFVFLDADVYLGNSWGLRIRVVMERLHSQSHIVSGSLCGISEENNWIERIWFAPMTTLKEVNYINSGHMVMHRDLFLRVGGFDPKLETGEDYEFCTRARMLGARIENDPMLRVVHAGYPKSIKSFFVRERWHARGDYKSLKMLISSKPAIVCLANLCMAVMCTIGFFTSSQPWFTFPLIYVLFFTGVSLSASIYRYRGKLNSGFVGAVFLYMVYFSARTVSLSNIIFQSLAGRILISFRHMC
jgi:glycosyltransferase involved in cell wall biosynthesis